MVRYTRKYYSNIWITISYQKESPITYFAVCFLPSLSATDQFGTQSYKGKQMGQNTSLSNLHTLICFQITKSHLPCIMQVSNRAHIQQIYFPTTPYMSAPIGVSEKSLSQPPVHKTPTCFLILRQHSHFHLATIFCSFIWFTVAV